MLCLDKNINFLLLFAVSKVLFIIKLNKFNEVTKIYKKLNFVAKSPVGVSALIYLRILAKNSKHFVSQIKWFDMKFI